MLKKLYVVFMFAGFFLFTVCLYAAQEGKSENEVRNAPPLQPFSMMHGNMSNMSNIPQNMEIPGRKKSCAFCVKLDMIIRNGAILGLTQEQTGKIIDLKNECKKTHIIKNAEIETFEVDLEAFLNKEEIDYTALKERIKKTAEIGSGIQVFCIDSLSKGMELLTKEQQKNLFHITDMQRRNMMMQNDRMNSQMRNMMPQMPNKMNRQPEDTTGQKQEQLK
ncbi:hypothetical protein HY745_12200 [Candidatus Desantisbacteria bacterium]|nr:hypothetical protein [Candidatus Desantisbacteria bacterium]